MKSYKFKLREKITMIFIICSTIMCIGLTLSVFRSADEVVKSMPTIPAASIDDMKYNSETIIIPRILPITKIEQENEKFKLETFYIMIGIIFLGSGIIFLFIGKSLKPLETLTDEVWNQKIEDLSKDIPLPYSNDEIFKLTQAFNERNKQIYESYFIQKNFSANAVHELYTPLAIMQTKLDVFSLIHNRSIEEYESLIGFVEENTKRLSAIIENLMKITNSDDVDLSQRIFLNGLIEETFFELEDDMNKQNIIAQVKGKNTIVKGNDTLLKQVIYNLINNAVKYNVNGGTILVSIEDAGDRVKISISDTGIGIPNECKEHLFEPFYRVDKSRSREIGGSGLGLALVKKIIELHNGEIIIEDNIPKGTIFTIILGK
ncbi:sensor histidine kinase [Clostridium butyricum]|uniref:sensor histidine kinase n=1 Tax=Clostridium butyricum TaxID=1492 RepID=UPI00374E6738